MKDLFKKYKKLFLAGAATAVLGGFAYLMGIKVDIATLGKDAVTGDPTSIAKQIEDAANQPVEE